MEKNHKHYNLLINHDWKYHNSFFYKLQEHDLNISATRRAYRYHYENDVSLFSDWFYINGIPEGEAIEYKEIYK